MQTEAENYPVSVVRKVLPAGTVETDCQIRLTVSGYGVMSDCSGISLLQPGTAVIIREDENPQINLLTETVFLILKQSSYFF